MREVTGCGHRNFSYQSNGKTAWKTCLECGWTKDITEQLVAAAELEARTKARDVIDRLCRDPQMWATHGMPGDGKLQRLEDEFTAAFRCRHE